MARVSGELVAACCDLFQARRKLGLSLAQVRGLLGDPARPIGEWPPAAIRAVARKLNAAATPPGSVRDWRPPFTRPR